MLRSTSVLLLAGALLFAVGDQARAADEISKVDAQAMKAFRSAAEHLQSLDRFSVSMHSTMHADLLGESKPGIPSDYKLVIERPNRFAIMLEDGETGATMISDGKQQVTYLPRKRKYSVQDAESSLAAVASGRSLIAQEVHWLAFWYLFLLFDPPTDFEKEIVHAESIGEERIGGVAVDHLRIGIDDRQCDYWVEKGGKPWVRKIVPDLQRTFQGVGPAGLKLEAVAQFDAWKADPQLPAETFRFVPPPNADKVDSVVKSRRSDKDYPLLGKPTPEFVANGLDGQPVRLADLKRKGVVVIQFWFPGSESFTELMAKLVDITAEHKEQGLTFLAVAVGGDVDGVREHLKQNNLDVHVVIDPEGEIAGQYAGPRESAAVLPLIVLVGKEGTVQAVHGSLPFDEKDEKRLRRELDALLEGKTLTDKQATPDPSDGGPRGDPVQPR